MLAIRMFCLRVPAGCREAFGVAGPRVRGCTCVCSHPKFSKQEVKWDARDWPSDRVRPNVMERVQRLHNSDGPSAGSSEAEQSPRANTEEPRRPCALQAAARSRVGRRARADAHGARRAPARTGARWRGLRSRALALVERHMFRPSVALETPRACTARPS